MHQVVGTPGREPILPSTRHDPRAAKILAQSIFRDMSHSGLSHEQMLGVASQLIGMVTEHLREKNIKDRTKA